MMQANFDKMIGKTILSIEEEEDGLVIRFSDHTTCTLFPIRPGKSFGCLWAVKEG